MLLFLAVILIIIAMNVKGGLSITSMGLVVAILAWLFPARTIRAQVSAKTRKNSPAPTRNSSFGIPIRGSR